MSADPSIFRKVALERLSTPEQLDQTMRVTSPLSWLMLISLLIFIVASILLGVVAKAPVKVAAQGILISPGGVLAIASEHGGRITKLDVTAGGAVKAGQVVAHLEQPDLRSDLDNARRELDELQRQKEQIHEFQNRDMKVQLALLAQKRRDLGEQVRHMQARIKWLQERADNEEGLLARQIIDRNRFINTKVELNGAFEGLSRANNELKQVERDETALTIGKERELLDKEMAIGAAQRRIDALGERLARQSVVVSPYDGDVVETKFNVGDVVERNVALMSVLPKTNQSDHDLVAVVYVAPNDGKKIQAGMVAQIAPSTVKREEYGFITGQVLQVAEIPSSAEGMMRTLKNRQLVDSLSGGGAPFEVTLRLDRDTATPTGFRWSSSRGPEADINSGTLAEAHITVRDIHLISLVIPALEQILDR